MDKPDLQLAVQTAFEKHVDAFADVFRSLHGTPGIHSYILYQAHCTTLVATFF